MRFVRPPLGRPAVVWDPPEYPLVIVREPGTGRIIGIGTSGTLPVPTTANRVDVLLSDGLGSVVRALTLR